MLDTDIDVLLITHVLLISWQWIDRNSSICIHNCALFHHRTASAAQRISST